MNIYLERRCVEVEIETLDIKKRKIVERKLVIPIAMFIYSEVRC